MTDTPPKETLPDQLQDEALDQLEETGDEEALLQKIVEYKNLAVRATADYRNLQRESDQRMQTMRQFANDQLLTELCPLVDYFDSALAAVPSDQADQSWIQGVRHIQDYLMKILKDNNVERMPTAAQLFDPNLHEAVGEEVSDQPDQTIIREVQAGFTLHGKVIRHAKVIIAKHQLTNQ
ncbi:MAG: nucleotide exchange factor GrpE [Candidatus Kerfeldbacteria bacterium]|nr:nucleotide exchange factor GrpE [Candidatus Kerfeldbacteria bacterium]